ncbi:MAG: hypothetical protein R3C03_24330, partial [Pirellulaceae bacterium]
MSQNQSSSCPAEAGNICARRHWSIYWLIIGLAFASVVSNILHVQNRATRGESPFFSANDRSRWCTIYSLVHFGTYEIDRVVDRDSNIHWDTIDKVVHVGRDGTLHQFSSKPPLFPTIVAGLYWCIERATGWNLDDNPILIARIILILVNAIPFAIMLAFLAAVLERLPVSDWTRYFILAAGGFGTFLSTFAITLNNHLPAAVCAMAVIYFIDRVYRDSAKVGGWTFFLCGIAAGFAAANELPALSLVAAAFGLLFLKSFTKTLFAFIPGVTVIAAGFFGTNYLSHLDWRPAYDFRNDGAVVQRWQEDFSADLDAGVLPQEISDAIAGDCSSLAQPQINSPYVQLGTWMGQGETIRGRWVVRDFTGPTQFAIVLNGDGSTDLRRWNNWYDFPGSYWSANAEKRS